MYWFYSDLFFCICIQNLPVEVLNINRDINFHVFVQLVSFIKIVFYHFQTIINNRNIIIYILLIEPITL